MQNGCQGRPLKPLKQFHVWKRHRQNHVPQNIVHRKHFKLFSKSGEIDRKLCDVESSTNIQLPRMFKREIPSIISDECFSLFKFWRFKAGGDVYESGLNVNICEQFQSWELFLHDTVLSRGHVLCYLPLGNSCIILCFFFFYPKEKNYR